MLIHMIIKYKYILYFSFMAPVFGGLRSGLGARPAHSGQLWPGPLVDLAGGELQLGEAHGDVGVAARRREDRVGGARLLAQRELQAEVCQSLFIQGRQGAYVPCVANWGHLENFATNYNR